MKFLGYLFVAALVSAPAALAGEWKSLDGTEPKKSPPSSSSGGQATVGSKNSTRPQRSTDSNATDPDTALAMMAEKYKNTVGIVVIVGKNRHKKMGTAWAVRPSWFATNSHISDPVKAFLDKGIDVFIAVNKSQKRYRVVEAISHPRYGETKRNFEGKLSFALSHDVGLLKIEGSTSKLFPLATINELRKLASGSRIAYLGFPSENMEGGNVDIHRPLATMQSGIITTISDYWLGDSGFEKNLLLRHNLGAAGGASGSPIFNTRGKVVGILNAGNVIYKYIRDKQGKILFDKGGDPIWERTPSGVMVNFAQRIDLLNNILP